MTTRDDAKKRHDATGDSNEAEANLSKYIDDNLVGQRTTFRGPFGRKRVVYCDNSKTGLALGQKQASRPILVRGLRLDLKFFFSIVIKTFMEKIHDTVAL